MSKKIQMEAASTKRKPSADKSARSLRKQLLSWYDGAHRRLPWRETRDPYRIWVSEIMLQQTRVQAVIPYYERFLARFPNVESLAQAPEEQLLTLWSGLGYYSRARNLARAAQIIATRHGGAFPRSVEDAMALPGIGQYTAAAILSIAYGVRLAVLDGNVARVLSRVFAIPADSRSTQGRNILMTKAEELLAPLRPGDFNQAMMELGAKVCVPQNPRCNICPISTWCAAFLNGQVDQFPPENRKPATVARRFVAALIRNEDGKYLLTRRPSSAQWMKGFWELPMYEQTDASPKKPKPAFNRIALGAPLGVVRHTITKNKLDVRVFQASLNQTALLPTEKWAAREEIEELPVTTITRKALRLAASGLCVKAEAVAACVDTCP